MDQVLVMENREDKKGKEKSKREERAKRGFYGRGK